MRRISTGFTIVEMMIAIMIIGFFGIILYKNSFFINMKKSVETPTVVTPEKPKIPLGQHELPLIEPPAATTTEEPTTSSSQSGVTTPTSQPPVTTKTSTYEKLSSFDVPTDVGFLQTVLLWADGQTIYKPELVLIDPSGKEATPTTYPGSGTMTNSARTVQTVIKYPTAGTWTAYVRASQLPDDLNKYYYFIASVKDQ